MIASRKNRQKTSKAKRLQRKQPKVGRDLDIIPRRFGFAYPRTRVTLSFFKFFTLANVGNTATNVRFIPTYAYDVDPTVGSTAMPGFTEWAGMYRFYRVVSADAELHFSNSEAFTMTAYACPANSDPGANYSAATSVTYLANPLGRSTDLGPLTGNGIGKMRLKGIGVRDYGGSWNPMNADNYSGSTGGGAPANNFYITVGTVGTAVGTAAGCSCTIKLYITLDFFEYTSPAT